MIGAVKMKSSVAIALLLSIVYATIASIEITGDLKIIGLFAIHEKDTGRCSSDAKIESVMAAEAVKWYITQLNQRASLPVNVGFQALETCRLTEKAAEHAVNIMDKILNNESYIAGVVGPEFSFEAEVISPILSAVPPENRLVQLGFSTTSTSLDDNNKYPNFVRVIPDDIAQVEAMVQAMLALKWNRFAVIYDERYGRDSFERLQQRAMEENICISLSRGLVVDNGIDSVQIKTALNDIIFGTGSRPSIGGIVFLGDSITARTIFITLKSSGYSSVPILMLSEAINMDVNIFKELDGTIISKAKGTLTLCPPFKEVAEFQSHWKRIFTNSSIFMSESSSNPWLLDVYHTATNCITKDCTFQPMTELQYSAAFPKQPLYIQYAILATHALIKATKSLHSKYCSNNGLCGKFKDNFRSGEILETLKGSEINMRTDFGFRLDSLSTDHYTYTIDQMGKLHIPDNGPKYQLYNFRKKSSTETQFDLIKIGELLNEKMNVSFSEIRDYTSQSAEKLWPDVRIPSCPVQTKCSECISMKDVYETVIFDPGDLYLIGVVPIFDSEGVNNCGNIRVVSGYQAAESIRFAVEKTNEKAGDYTTLFQGIKIGSIILNSCNSQVVVQRKLYQLYNDGVKLPNGTLVALKGKILGFVGDIGSSISIAAAEVLSRLRFVQISFASTNPSLSDRSKYPFFSRVVTPDDAQAKAMIELVKTLKADFIQIVHSSEAYGEGGRDKIKESARANQVCVINEIPVAEDGNPYEVYENLRKYKHAYVVIVFLRSHKVIPVISTLVSQMNKGEFIFIGSEAWARKTDPLDVDTKQALLGSLTLSLEMYEDKELRTYIQNLKPLIKSVNPWITLFLQAQRKCYFEDSFDKSVYQVCTLVPNLSDFSLDSWDTAAFVAARSLLIASSTFFKQKCGTNVKQLCTDFTSNPEGLTEEIRKVRLDLDGSGNKLKVFNSNGDGNLGYRIYNIQKDVDNPQKLVYVEVGRYTLEGTFTFEESLLVRPTDENLVSVCPNEQACAGCFQKGDYGGKALETESEHINPGMLALGIIVGLTIIVIITLTVVVVCLRRKISRTESDIYIHPKASSEEFHSVRQEALGGEAFPAVPQCSGSFDNISHSSNSPV